MFYLKCRSLQERTALISYAKEHGVQLVFHYVPLHSAPAGIKFGRFDGEDVHTTAESERLVRLPMYYNLSENEVQTVIDVVKSFFA